jgi:hypothetical protein
MLLVKYFEYLRSHNSPVAKKEVRSVVGMVIARNLFPKELQNKQGSLAEADRVDLQWKIDRGRVLLT